MSPTISKYIISVILQESKNYLGSVAKLQVKF